MGDGGSYFLGFTLASISIVGPAKGLTTVSLLLPLLILSLPLADMSAVIMGRLREGRSPFYPDRRHLHHRLLRAGFSHRRTVLLIYVFVISCKKASTENANGSNPGSGSNNNSSITETITSFKIE